MDGLLILVDGGQRIAHFLVQLARQAMQVRIVCLRLQFPDVRARLRKITGFLVGRGQIVLIASVRRIDLVGSRQQRNRLTILYRSGDRKRPSWWFAAKLPGAPARAARNLASASFHAFVPPGKSEGPDPEPSCLRVSVSRASASLVRKVESDPWPPTAVQSVTPAMAKFG